MRLGKSAASLALIFFAAGAVSCGSVSVEVVTPQNPIAWGTTVVISDPPTFADGGPDARGIRPGTFGAWYGRMVKLLDGSWLCTYGVYDNWGYLSDPQGGVRQQVACSTDGGRTWSVLATVADPGRDLENGQMIQLANGDVLMAARSVRWQESYRLPVFRSTDRGATWSYVSTIDSNEGAPGTLGNPDKGLYEPHFGLLGDGSLAVMYANEKHVVENPSYSQIISQRVSLDNGTTWGDEIWVASEPGAARPGMPVWTRMGNGKYIVVYEVCGTQGCNVFFKWSEDGTTWPSGIGRQVPAQQAGPYVLSLLDGRLLVTSNQGVVSYSADYGAGWHLADTPPFSGPIAWPSIHQTGPSEVAVVASVGRPQGGARLEVRFGTLQSTQQ